MSVEGLVKRLRDGCNLQQRDGEIAADKLEELAAENEQAAKQRDIWIEAALLQQRKREEAEAALAEAKRENEALREAMKKDPHSVWWRDYYEWLEARNAGGNGG